MQVETIREDQFKKSVLEAGKPVLVDFYADWCGPCKMMVPILDSLAAELGDRAIVVKVNVDENPNLSQKYNIMTIPNLIVFDQGEEKESLVGVQTKNRLLEALGF